MKRIVSFEEAKQYFKDDKQAENEVINSKWKRHWNNAKNANSIECLSNLLKNHLRLLNEIPDNNNGKERENIILFIQNKLNNLSMQV